MRAAFLGKHSHRLSCRSDCYGHFELPGTVCAIPLVDTCGLMRALRSPL